MTRQAPAQLDLLQPVAPPAAAKPAKAVANHHCRTCGKRMEWPGPAGVVYADRSEECRPCLDGGQPA